MVLTQLPVWSLLQKVDYTGRIAKWGTILGAFDIKYVPRTFIKGQVFTNLVAKFTESLVKEEGKGLSSRGRQVQAISRQGHSP